MSKHKLDSYGQTALLEGVSLCIVLVDKVYDQEFFRKSDIEAYKTVGEAYDLLCKAYQQVGEVVTEEVLKND